MEVLSRHDRPVATADGPDLFYALVVGIYAAVLSTPAVLGAAAAIRPENEALTVAVALVAVPGLIAGVARFVRTRRGLAARLGAGPRRFGFLVVPVAFLVGYLGAIRADVLGPFALLGVFTAVGGALLGLVLVGMSRTRHAAAVVDEDDVTVEWEAGWPRPSRRLVVATSVVLMGVATIGLAAAWMTGRTGATVVVYGGLMVGSVLASVGQPRRYRATPVGLERNFDVYRSVTPWDAVAGFSETDEALLIHWRTRVRPPIRCGWDQIDDREALVSALERHLERR